MDPSGTRTSVLWLFAIKCPNALPGAPILNITCATFQKFSGAMGYSYENPKIPIAHVYWNSMFLYKISQKFITTGLTSNSKRNLQKFCFIFGKIIEGDFFKFSLKISHHVIKENKWNMDKMVKKFAV
jgi:hypothetical protein